MALAIYGRTGIGKSFTLFTTLKNAKREILFARSLEDLDQFNSTSIQFTDIIFDDISFRLSRPELLIHLTDPLFHCPVRILRNSVRIPNTVKKWFTHNNKSAWQPILATYEQQQAIDRRLTVVKVQERFEVFKTVDNFLHKDDESDTDESSDSSSSDDTECLSLENDDELLVSTVQQGRN